MQDRILEECFRIIHEGVERAENVYEIKVIVFLLLLLLLLFLKFRIFEHYL